MPETRHTVADIPATAGPVGEPPPPSPPAEEPSKTLRFPTAFTVLATVLLLAADLPRRVKGPR
jgi:hypothetical protein